MKFRNWVIGAVMLIFAGAGQFAQAQEALVAVDQGANAVYTVDKFTGAKTFVTPIFGGPVSPAGLAYDRVNDILYMSDGILDNLYRLNPITGVAVLVGPFAIGNPTMHGLEYDDRNGNLYGSDWTTNSLYLINTVTGAAGLIGPMAPASLSSIGYDSKTDTMYASSIVTDSLYSVNVATGASTLVGPFLGAPNTNGFAYDWSANIMYMLDNALDALVGVDLTTGKVHFVGSTGAGNLLGLAYVKSNGRLIAIDSSRAMSEINMLTGAKVAIGVANAAAGTTGGLAYDRHDNIVYLTSTSLDSLYRLDIATGNVVLVGAYGNPAVVMHGLEWDEFHRKLYGASSHNNGLYEINTTTGVATLIGTSVTTSFMNLCYNSYSDTMYATSSGSDSFYQMNLVSGIASLIGPLVGPTNPNGMAFCYSNGRLFLIDNNTDSLYTINMTTGLSSLVGPNGVGNMLGLAYVNPCPGNTVNGIVNFGQLGGSAYYVGPLPSVLEVSWRTPANVEVATGLATYDPSNGHFSATSPTGFTFSYRISFKHSFWLRKTLPDPAGAAQPLGSWFFGVRTMTPGDADDDNDVTNGDYAVWAGTNGNVVPPGSGADFDGDGDITNSDYAIWAAANGESGDL